MWTSVHKCTEPQGGHSSTDDISNDKKNCVNWKTFGWLKCKNIVYSQ